MIRFSKETPAASRPMRIERSRWPTWACGYVVNLSETYVQLGREQEGLALLKRAVELEPDCPQTHDSLGLAHLGTGNREEAMKKLHAIQLLDESFEGELGKKLASAE